MGYATLEYVEPWKSLWHRLPPNIRSLRNWHASRWESAPGYVDQVKVSFVTPRGKKGEWIVPAKDFPTDELIAQLCMVLA